MFLENIRVVTIDGLETKRMEDGFWVNPETKDVYIVSVIPNFSLLNFDRVEKAIKDGKPMQQGSTNFFNNTIKGLTKETFCDVIVYHSSPPYTSATLGLGSAIIHKAYTFEKIDAHKKPPSQIALFKEYASQFGLIDTTAQGIVNFAINQLNKSALSAMKQEGIPFLSLQKGRISCTGGFPKINRPYRDVISLINTSQLKMYFEKGNFNFTFQELFSFTRGKQSA